MPRTKNNRRPVVYTREIDAIEQQQSRIRYQHYTREERLELISLVKGGLTQAQAARRLGFKSTSARLVLSTFKRDNRVFEKKADRIKREKKERKEASKIEMRRKKEASQKKKNTKIEESDREEKPETEQKVEVHPEEIVVKQEAQEVKLEEFMPQVLANQEVSHIQSYQNCFMPISYFVHPYNPYIGYYPLGPYN